MREHRLDDPASLRGALREQTAAIHQLLDDRVGHFVDAAQYRRFVVQSYRFRRIAEPATAGNEFWQPLGLVASLVTDLQDLGLPLPPTTSCDLALTGGAEKLGALYVLEGSALGSRLLQKRAAELGFTPSFGARHLAQQTADNGRWKAFVAVLDRPEIDQNAALSGALRTFEVALKIYSEVAHELA
jgi:heme oxygenase (biliverdin-IX-beta and delta-forming)